MITSALDEIIIAADEARCEEFFRGMKETQRKELAPRALQWASALNGFVNRQRQQFLVFDKNAGGDIEFYRSIELGKLEFPKDFKEESFPIARMAVLATSNFPELKKVGLKAIPAPRVAARILIERKPSWIDKWCAYVLKEANGTHWLSLYLLKKEGLCKLEHSSSYWLSMLCGLSLEPEMMSELLAADPGLAEDVWTMLEDASVARALAEPEQIAHEIFRKRWTSGGNIFAAMEGATRQGNNTFHQSLIQMAEKSLLDRNRLIDYSFNSLSNIGEREAKRSPYQTVSEADFSMRLNTELLNGKTEPYANRFASLLKAAHKDVSSFASHALNGMSDQALNVEDICAEIAPAFLNKSKEPADAALKLLSRLAKTFPSRQECYGPAILSAFSHTSKDIHKKALALIESTKMLENSDLANEFSQRIDMLGGMERASAAKLVAKFHKTETSSLAAPATNSAGAVSTDGTTIAVDIDSLETRLAKLEANLVKCSGADRALESCKSSTVCDSAVDLNTFDFPRLDPEKAVKPIANVDDLIYMYMKVWSGKCTPMDLELVLDGVARLCNERPDDFRQKTDALRQKAEKSSDEYSMFSWAGPIAHLAFSWLGEPSNEARVVADLASFFARRCLALSKRVVARQAAPLLAAPTHAGGWIDPLILVKRVGEYFWLKLEPDRADFIQALLRLAPENRAAALETAAAIKGEVGEALRYALGSANMGRVVTPEFWVAAYRAREPRGTNEELRKILPKCGPDGVEAAVYGLNLKEVAEMADERFRFGKFGLPNFLPVASDDPNFPILSSSSDKFGDFAAAQQNYWTARSKYSFYPTVLLHDNAASWYGGSEPLNWLHNRESLLALYAKRMLLNIESTGTYWHGDFEFLFDPDVSLAENGRYFLCFAMSSKNNDLSRLAVDALIAAVQERRITAEGYGEAMAQILPSGVITAVRWVRGLRDASKSSTLHAWFVWKAVSRMIRTAEISATQQIPFVELLAEIQIDYSFAVDEDLKETLSGITGGGKAAKLAKTLLTFKHDAQQDKTREVSMQCADARVARAERWQAWLNEKKVEALA